MSRTDIPLRTTVWPTLRYRDANAAIRFLIGTLGFEEVAVYRNDDGTVVDHAELRWPGGGGIMLGSDRPDSSISSLPAGVGSIYIVVDNPDELYVRAQSGGATIAREISDEDYGSRGFTIRDPEGVHWSFGTYAGAGAGDAG